MSGSMLRMTFDKDMKDPVGKHGQFAVAKEGVPNVPLTPLSVSLNIDPDTIDLYLQEAIAYGDVIKVSYTAGTIDSIENKLLASFNNVAVNNLEIPPSQDWLNYPNTPFVLQAITLPYQAIALVDNYGLSLIASETPLHRNGTTYYIRSASQMAIVQLVNGSWNTQSIGWTSGNFIVWASNLYEANNPIYTNATLTIVDFAKTTP